MLFEGAIDFAHALVNATFSNPDITKEEFLQNAAVQKFPSIFEKVELRMCNTRLYKYIRSLSVTHLSFCFS